MSTTNLTEKIIQVGEEKITKVVDRILSRNYLNQGNRRRCVQETIASLDIPSRDETDALNAKLESIQNRVDELSAKLEDLTRVSREKKSPAKKTKKRSEKITK